MLFSSLLSLFYSSRKVKVVIVGLDNAGKSTILYKLWVKEVVCTVPTVGANHETFSYKNVNFEVCSAALRRFTHSLTVTAVPQMWDLGGQAALRTSWPVYYKNTDAIICVVDSTDRQRLGLVKASNPASASLSPFLSLAQPALPSLHTSRRRWTGCLCQKT